MTNSKRGAARVVNYPDLSFSGKDRGVESFRSYLDDGGFPIFLQEPLDPILRELLRDVVHRDVAERHGLRETRHAMNLVLFLLTNTGQPFSLQRLTKSLAIPSVAQTARYAEYLQDAYLLFGATKYSSSFKKRVTAPVKYYAIDNGLRRANSPQTQPDIGHRLENAVARIIHHTRGASLCLRHHSTFASFTNTTSIRSVTKSTVMSNPYAIHSLSGELSRVALHLRRKARELYYAGERDLWECDFITRDEAIQVCLELTEVNRGRELRGVVAGVRLGGKRRATVVTLDQADSIREEGVSIEIVPVWRWMT